MWGTGNCPLFYWDIWMVRLFQGRLYSAWSFGSLSWGWKWRRKIRNLGKAVRRTAWPGTPESDIYALWMAAAIGDGVGVGESLCCLYIHPILFTFVSFCLNYLLLVHIPLSVLLLFAKMAVLILLTCRGTRRMLWAQLPAQLPSVCPYKLPTATLAAGQSAGGCSPKEFYLAGQMFQEADAEAWGEGSPSSQATWGRVQHWELGPQPLILESELTLKFRGIVLLSVHVFLPEHCRESVLALCILRDHVTRHFLHWSTEHVLGSRY